jgi:hypothetical protein
MDIGIDPENTVHFFVVPVITQFVPDIQDQENAESNTDCKPKNIQDAIPFVSS